MSSCEECTVFQSNVKNFFPTLDFTMVSTQVTKRFTKRKKNTIKYEKCNSHISELLKFQSVEGTWLISSVCFLDTRNYSCFQTCTEIQSESQPSGAAGKINLVLNVMKFFKDLWKMNDPQVKVSILVISMYLSEVLVECVFVCVCVCVCWCRYLKRDERENQRHWNRDLMFNFVLFFPFFGAHNRTHLTFLVFTSAQLCGRKNEWLTSAW